jgi:hypothetical protein
MYLGTVTGMPPPNLSPEKTARGEIKIKRENRRFTKIAILS